MAVDIKTNGLYPGEAYYFLKNEGARCHLASGRGGIWLSSLYCEPDKRNSGCATEILTVAKRIARRLKKPLFLTANPFSDKPKPLPELVQYYSKRGFVPIKDEKWCCQMKYEAL